MKNKIQIDGVKAKSLTLITNRLQQMYNDDSIEVIDVKFSTYVKKESEMYCCLIIYIKKENGGN